MVNGERVLPIGLRSLLARLSAVNFSSISCFLTLTARKGGLNRVGNHAMKGIERGPRCELGVFDKGMDDTGIAMGGRELWV